MRAAGFQPPAALSSCTCRQPARFWQDPLQAVRAAGFQPPAWVEAWAGRPQQAQLAAASRAVEHPGGEYAVAVPDTVARQPVQTYSSARSAGAMQQAYKALSAPLARYGSVAVTAVKQRLPTRSNSFSFGRQPPSPKEAYRAWLRKMRGYLHQLAGQVSAAASWSQQTGRRCAASVQHSSAAVSSAVRPS